MTDDATLPKRLVAQKAEAIFSQRRRRLAALLEGRGEPDRVRIDDFDVEIVPTECELDLRRKMAERERGQRDARTLYLVDWAAPGELARDLRARVAEGKVYRIGREERLRQVFHATRFGPDLVRSPLAALAVLGEIEEFPQSPRLTLDLTFACFSWLERVVRDPFSSSAPTEEDFVRACSRSDGTAWAEKAERDPEWRRWLDEVAAILERSLSPLSGVVWRAWLAGQVADVPAVLWLLEAFVRADAHERDRRLCQRVLRERYPLWWAAAEALPMTADGATVDAWDALLRGEGASHPPRGLADLAREIDIPEVFRASCRMVEGLRAREAALAEALTGLIAALDRPDGSDEPWGRTREAFDALRDHRALRPARRDQPAPRRTALDMLQRLAAWVWSRRSEAVVPPGGAVPAAMELAQRYAADGGYVDWARRVSGVECPKGPLGDAWQALRGRIEARRDAQEKVFAAGMREWAARGRTPSGCLPIELASRELVARFLDDGAEGEGRRLLVLLMDGMSWARCRELVHSLRELEGWEPIRWRPRAGDPSLPPVLAAFPTITSVSRSAFFAGALPPPGEEPSTAQDPARWRENPAVERFVGPRGALELFLKDKVEGERGQPSEEVLEAVGDPERPLVAVVVNTIDDALKATPSLEFSTGAVEIKPLRELLLRARQARRAVLLVADHGHVLGERFDRVDVPKEAGGARWRVHDGVTEPRADEVLLEDGAWSPDASKPVVVLAGERACYSIHSHHGEHGGLSMAEVVAPAVLLGTPELAEACRDPALEIAPPDDPVWWRDMEPSEPAESRKAIEPRRSLFDGLEAEAPSGPPRPQRGVVEPKWLANLRKAPAFKTALSYAPVAPNERERLTEQTLAVCRVLVDGGGRASMRAIAQAVDIALGRAGGLVARVRSVLNAEGETCLTEDRATDSVVLEVERFERLFGVDTRKE